MLNIQSWLQPGEALSSAAGRFVHMGQDDQAFAHLGGKHIIWSSSAHACVIVGACDDNQAVLMHITPDADLKTAFTSFGKKIKGDARWYFVSLNQPNRDKMRQYVQNLRGIAPTHLFSIESSRLAIDARTGNTSCDFDIDNLPQ